jgi:NAD(P)-dependent dehydrogenase (short-subunit alcohol dehydrogenase family)
VSEAQDVQLAVFRVAEVALGGVPGAEDPELDLSPLHTPCTLREAGVRDRRAIPDEHHDRDLPGMYMVQAGTLPLGIRARLQFDAARKRAKDRKKRVKRPRERMTTMTEDQHRQQDPTQQYPQPEYPEQDQRDQHPGLEQEMQPEPDYGVETYRGSGKLEGKKAVITGGDSGIGRAVALAFAREGADVVISYLEEEEPDAQETARVVEEAGREAVRVPGDVRDETHCQSLVQKAVEEFGRIDVLINNAAYQMVQPGGIADITTEQFDRVLKTNLYAMFWLSKAGIPHMRPGASIINTTSIEAYQPEPGLLDYASTKGAIVTFTKGLAQDLIAQGIRVNAVAPGPVWTPLIPATMPAEQVTQFGASESPIGRPAQPAELAPPYVFLASQESSYVSGQVLGVTGGAPLS